VESEAWAPAEKDLAAKESAVKAFGAPETAPKEQSTVEKEAWSPEENGEATKEEAAKEGAVKESGGTEKEDWWLT
jgi:hypothetical protein